MGEHMQVKEFCNPTSDMEKELNEFLKSKGTRVVSVNSFYNTILGGINYVVTYWC